MDRWEAILKLYDYRPDINRYKCNVCGKLFKIDNRIYYHIDNQHNQEINKIRHESIK